MAIQPMTISRAMVPQSALLAGKRAMYADDPRFQSPPLIPGGQQISARPGGNMLYAGGNQFFDERTGTYAGQAPQTMDQLPPQGGIRALATPRTMVQPASTTGQVSPAQLQARGFSQSDVLYPPGVMTMTSGPKPSAPYQTPPIIPPRPQQTDEMMYSGGTPNFDERTGTYTGGATTMPAIERDARGIPLPGSRSAVPATGLIGSEQALSGALSGSLDALAGGYSAGRGDILGALTLAQGRLSQNPFGNGAAPGGMSQAERDAILSNFQTTGAIPQPGTYTTAPADLARVGNYTAGQFSAGGGGGAGQFTMEGVGESIGQGVGSLQGFADPGVAAQQRQAALSGALGAEAQRRAFAEFQESPGQAFLREQAERSLLRNQAAVGGLGGGRVLEELQRQAIGLAQQDFQNQFERLGAVTGTGLQAAGQIGQLRGQQAGLFGQRNIARGQAETQANIERMQAETQANIAAGQAQTQAGIARGQAETQLGLERLQAENQARMARGQAETQTNISAAENALRMALARGQTAAELGTEGSRLAMQRYLTEGQTRGQMLSNAADIAASLGGQLGRLGQEYGAGSAGAISNIGQLVSAGRTRAGEQIAGNVGGTSAAIADLLRQRGLDLGTIVGQAGGNYANLLQAAAEAQAAGDTQLATILANIATGQGSSVAGLPALGGLVQTPNYMQQYGQLAGAIGNMISAYQNRGG